MHDELGYSSHEVYSSQSRARGDGVTIPRSAREYRSHGTAQCEVDKPVSADCAVEMRFRLQLADGGGAGLTAAYK